MCTCVNAIENARAAALPSRYLRASASAASRSGATPVANATRTNAPGRKADALAQRRNRIEHRAGRAGQRPAVERHRVGRRSAAAEEARAIGLPLDGAAERGPSTPSTWKPTIGDSSAAARPAAEEEAGALRIEFGLDEQLAERRMREVVLGPRQHDLGVAGDLDLARLRRCGW